MKNNKKLDDLLIHAFLKEGLGEQQEVFSHVQIISDLLDKVTPKSLQDKRRIDMIKSHLKAIKRKVRRLENELDEQE